MLPRMSGCVNTFRFKDGDNDKNNKLMSFRINDEKLLEKYKTIWTNIEDLKVLIWMLYQSMMIDI